MRESERERERERDAQRCIGLPTDCSLAPQWRRRPISELGHSGAAHRHPAFYSVAYRRAAYASVQELLVALPCLDSVLALASRSLRCHGPPSPTTTVQRYLGFPVTREWERCLSPQRGPDRDLSLFDNSLRFSLHSKKSRVDFLQNCTTNPTLGDV